MRTSAILLAAALLPVSTHALAAPSPTEHVVAEGETLNGIANRAGVSAKALAKANGLKPPFALRNGQTLKLPRATTAKVAATKPGSAKPAPKPAAPKPSTAASAAPVRRADSPALDQESVHLVTPGETLGGIANRAKVPRVLIAEANGLTPPYEVQPGRRLLIPRTRHYVVKPGDTGFDIAYRQGVPWSQIAVANGLDANAAVKPGKELLIPTVFDPQLPSQAASTTATRTAATANTVAAAAAAAASAPTGGSAPRFAWPLSGTVKRGWKTRSDSDYHDGLDIAANLGAPVKAAAPGTVIYAGPEAEQFGNLVVVDHGGGWNTAYGFLSKITVTKGARIAAGQRIGLVGATGKARGNELHFEVRQDGVPVDPATALPKAP
jgi:murein DD-endopeptidase MepM/ murein hydrolase activator NlpD